ncbi:MAG: SCP2 sterol-binding domain-containing protein [Xanthomonadaceae bacterium]|nr:SCP2 sterol-binding domain-containing protein [Xanthomonadaceae bacterium]
MPAPAPNALIPPPLRAVAGRLLQTALNRALALDPDAVARLAALQGRTLSVHLRGPGLALTLGARDGALTIGPPAADAALHVGLTPGALLKLALAGGDGALAPGAVEIAGDADLARRLERLAREFRPDFEQAFADSFGEVLGVPLARAFASGLAAVRRGAQHAAADGADWLRDEARLTPARAEVEDFLDAVDTLRERADRLQARVDALAARAGSRG